MITTKKSKTIADRITQLEERGLKIDNHSLLYSTIKDRTTYYHLTGYRFLLDRYNYDEDSYHNHCSSELIALYDLDTQLSVLFFKEIRLIEQSLRTKIANLCKENEMVTFKLDENSQTAILETNTSNNNQSNYKFIAEDRFQNSISNQIFIDLYKTKEEPAIKHYLNQYDKVIPIWVAINFINFGTLIQLLDCLTTAKLNEFMNGLSYKKGKTPNDPTKTHLKAIQMLRNKISHHSNILGKRTPFFIKGRNYSIYFIGYSGICLWKSFLLNDNSVTANIHKEINSVIAQINSRYNTQLEFSIFMNKSIR